MNRYYQQTYRDVHGRVRSRYYGRGPVAVAVATLDARERDRRVEKRTLDRAARERIASIERPVLEYSKGVDELFTAWMRLTGWHLHRGQWRRTGLITRRVIMSQGFQSLETAAQAEEFGRWLMQGDFDAMMLRYGADMAKNTIDLIISNITDDPIRRECIRLKVGRLEHELAGESPSPIERVLAERVAVCYLDAYYSDLLAQSPCNISGADFYQRRQDRASRRYLQAVEGLARCRKLETATIRETVERRLQVIG